jgi:putative redox protein
MDGAPDGGGRNLAPRPMEVVLAGTGGCTAYDVVVILRKSGQDVRGCDVTLKSSAPRPIQGVHQDPFHFTVRGRNLKTNVVERAIKLSHDKYCSASIMLEDSRDHALLRDHRRPDRYLLGSRPAAVSAGSQGRMQEKAAEAAFSCPAIRRLRVQIGKPPWS